MTIKDIILVSDLDGTVVPITGIISQKNIDAIKQFRSLGGTFTIATGRSPRQAIAFLEQMEVDTPMIANNGGIIYDPQTGKNLWSKTLDSSYKEVVLDIKKRFPKVGIVAISDSDRHDIIVSHHIAEEYEQVSEVRAQESTDGKLCDDCCKVLFRIEEAEISQVSIYLLNQYPQMQFVRSGINYIEMLPKGITKGFPFEKLVQLCGKKLENSVAIGDYDNDVEMIEKAAIGVAVQNAVEDVRAVANLKVKSCEEDGLADLISYLINHSE